MKTVGVKVLKNNLSRYLKLVQEGEIVLVSDRNEVIAEISKPVTAIRGEVSKWEDFCNRLVRKGTMIPAKRRESIVRALIRKRDALPTDGDIQKTLKRTRANRK